MLCIPQAVLELTILLSEPPEAGIIVMYHHAQFNIFPFMSDSLT
jgi:hypothetical protein